MRKCEKFFWVGVTIAEIAVLVFWMAGCQGQFDVAKWAFFTGGLFAWIALICLGIGKLHFRYLED